MSNEEQCNAHEKETIYLVTGAAGFLGINVTKALVDQGKKVRTLVLEGDPAAKNIPAEAEMVTGNLLDPDSLEHFFNVHSEIIVLHIASFVTVVPDWSQKVYEVNVIGTKNIIQKCREFSVKKLVYISSTHGNQFSLIYKTDRILSGSSRQSSIILETGRLDAVLVL